MKAQRENRRVTNKLLSVLLSISLAGSLTFFPSVATAEEPTEQTAEDTIQDGEELGEEIEAETEDVEFFSAIQLKSADAVEFLYIDSAEITPGTEQNIAVSLNEEYADLNTATISLVDSEGEDAGSYEASTIVGSAALFSFDTSIYGGGEYFITKVDFATLEGSYTIDFSDSEVRSFVVADAVSLLGLDDEEEAAEEAEESFTAYALDEDGNMVEAESVGAAVAKAQAASATKSAGQIIVALDPGHGGTDPGALGNGLREANLTWKIANYCKEELENTYGITVVLTRTQNECPDLDVRCQRAADAGASVCISIHINSASAGAYGSEVWVPNNSSYNNETHSVGEQLGKQILAKLAELGLYNRGVKTKNYSDSGEDYRYSDGSEGDYYGIIRYSRELGLTGIIIEHAFITNSSDASKYLSSDAKLKALGVADAKGIAQDLSILGSKEEYYSPVYDYEYYRANNEDLEKAYGDKQASYFQHFLKYGMKEGRQACASFDIHSYYNANSDLRIAYGTNLQKFYEHYLKYGQKEGRKCTGVDELTEFVSTRDKVDYSPLYDGAYYFSKYEDLQKAFTKTNSEKDYVDDVALLRHFVNWGMKEGRTSSSTFDVFSYYNEYFDLRAAYGTDIAKYYTHYLKYGLSEGRNTSGCAEIQDFISSWGGTDYSPVYDGAYYFDRYSDLQKAFTNTKYDQPLVEDTALIRHFYNYGMKEGRQASENFSVSAYKARYADLRRAYGSNLKSYYLHYLRYGIKEGRITTDDNAASLIMGSTKTTADQLVRYYVKNVGESTYPSSVYSAKGASTLKQFCEIVIEEAKTEGVRAEVVFCQSMHETGWLKFGGQVSVEQCNFAGLGATNGGAKGATFSSVREGVRAQVQHLKAYASTDGLVNTCVDPRFNLVTRGCAPYLQDLNGRWAVPGNGYGEKILSMISSLQAC